MATNFKILSEIKTINPLTRNYMATLTELPPMSLPISYTSAAAATVRWPSTLRVCEPSMLLVWMCSSAKLKGCSGSAYSSPSPAGSNPILFRIDRVVKQWNAIDCRPLIQTPDACAALPHWWFMHPADRFGPGCLYLNVRHWDLLTCKAKAFKRLAKKKLIPFDAVSLAVNDCFSWLPVTTVIISWNKDPQHYFNLIGFREDIRYTDSILWFQCSACLLFDHGCQILNGIPGECIGAAFCGGLIWWVNMRFCAGQQFIACAFATSVGHEFTATALPTEFMVRKCKADGLHGYVQSSLAAVDPRHPAKIMRFATSLYIVCGYFRADDW